MPLRRTLLRVLLWSLGVAALCGVVAVLGARYGSVSRVMATAMLTAGASLLLLGAAYLVDRPLTRSAGLLGMAAVVVEYVLLLALMWLGGGDGLALTIGFIGAPVLPAMLCMAMACAAPTRVAGWFGLASCAAVCVLLLGGTWLHPYPWDDDTWYSLAGAVATFFPVALLCLVGAGTDRRHWRWAGVAAAVLACAGMFHALTAHLPPGGETALAVAVSVAAVVAHANVLMLLPLKTGQRWLRWLTILAAVATAFFTDLVIFDFEQGRQAAVLSELAERLASACAISAGCGTLALLVLGRLNRKVVRRVVTLGNVREVTLFCPACGKKQTVPAGEASCASCNVIIHTRFEEPRCRTCDYSLLMLHSDRCPECGTEVRAPAPGAGAGIAQRPGFPAPYPELQP